MCTIRLSAVAVLVVVLRAQTPDDSFRFVLTGDSIIGRRLSVYDEPAYLRMFDHIRSADATFTNFEMLVHNFDAGFKRFENAVVTISGIELAEKIKKGQFKTGKLGGPKASMSELWNAALAA